MSKRPTMTVVCTVALAGLSLCLAACSSSGSKSRSNASSASSASVPATSSSGSAATSSPAGDTASVVKFVGGKPGAADSSLQPITIGWTNQDALFPGATEAAQAAVDFLNKEAGGLAGHPIVLDKCAVNSAQDYQSCGVKFTDDSKIKAIVTGVVIVDDTSFFKGVGAEVPINETLGLQPADFDQPNAVVYTVSTADLFKGYAAVPTTLPKSTPVKIIYTPSAISSSSNATATAALKAAGYTDIAAVSVPETASVPDVTSALQSAGVKNGDILVTPLTAAQCIAVDVGLKSLNIKPGLFMTTNGCTNDAVLQHFNGGIPDYWRVVNQNTSPLVDTAADVPAYKSISKQYAPNAVGAAPAFGAVINLVKAGNQVGADATNSAWVSALKGFTGPAFLAPGALQCGHDPKTPSLCATQVPIMSYTDGKWTQTLASLD